MLRLRQRETSLAEQALGVALSAAGLAEARRDQVTRVRQAFEADLERRRSRGMAAWQWAVTCQQNQLMLDEEAAATAALREALTAVAASRSELVAAKRREQALNRLRERRWEAYRYEAERADQAETDEMARNVRSRQKEVG